MTSIRRIGTALTLAAALALPTLASAEQAPTEACDGEKAEHKQPTEERAKQESDKSRQKSDDKTDNKSDDKTAPNQSGKTS